MLGAMGERLRYLRPSMNSLLRSLIPLYPALGYLGQCRSWMDRGERFHSAWRKSIHGFPDLENEEREILLSLGDTLGSADLESQLAAISVARTALEERLSRAREDSRKHGNLYRALGVLGGLALVILIY